MMTMLKHKEGAKPAAIPTKIDKIIKSLDVQLRNSDVIDHINSVPEDQRIFNHWRNINDVLSVAGRTIYLREGNLYSLHVQQGDTAAISCELLGFDISSHAKIKKNTYLPKSIANLHMGPRYVFTAKDGLKIYLSPPHNYFVIQDEKIISFSKDRLLRLENEIYPVLHGQQGVRVILKQHNEYDNN